MTKLIAALALGTLALPAPEASAREAGLNEGSALSALGAPPESAAGFQALRASFGPSPARRRSVVTGADLLAPDGSLESYRAVEDRSWAVWGNVNPRGRNRAPYDRTLPERARQILASWSPYDNSLPGTNAKRALRLIADLP